MVKKYLVTTSLIETWPKNNNSEILFLGEWCVPYNINEINKYQRYDTLSFHWNDRSKYENDFNKINTIYEEKLALISLKLNKIHNVSFDNKYWRIIIGPWLYVYIGILYDKWESLNKAVAHHKSLVKIKINFDRDVLIPNDMLDFLKKTNTDIWNEAIYMEMLNYFLSKIEIINESGLKTSSVPIKLNVKYPIYLKVINKINELIENIWNLIFNSYFFSKNDTIFFINTYMPTHFLFKLQIKLNQIPKFWKIVTLPIFETKDCVRKILFHDLSSDNFNLFLDNILVKTMPKVYLEGYSILEGLTNKLNWPKFPKAIVTSNSFFEDDIFKFWLSEKSYKQKSKIIICQHGGNYGIGKFNSSQLHETKISDLYLTWGWGKNLKNNIYPMFNIRNVMTKLTYNKKGNVLLITTSTPKYTSQLYAMPVSSQFLFYFQNQVDFVSYLPNEIYNKLLVRISPIQDGWMQKQRWEKRFKNIKLDDGYKPLSKLIKNSRICISTYNATTFLETLFHNIPTLIYWDPKYWEINFESKKYFKLLNSVGIFHETPEAAANFLINIWDKIEEWWNSKATQDAVNVFCENYSKKELQPYTKFADKINEII
jgi:putative transferase (TIGR04331 family)